LANSQRNSQLITGRSNYCIGPYRTALGNIRPHWSFIVHRIGPQTLPRQSEKTNYSRYSQYCSSSTLINNAEFVIVTGYVLLNLHLQHLAILRYIALIIIIIILSQYNNMPSTRSGECRRKFKHCHCRHWHRRFI